KFDQRPLTAKFLRFDDIKTSSIAANKKLKINVKRDQGAANWITG
ncbi:462_t:CDS:1, partial [Gigaspora rosea]